MMVKQANMKVNGLQALFFSKSSIINIKLILRIECTHLWRSNLYCFSASLSLTKNGDVSIKKKTRQNEEQAWLEGELFYRIFQECWTKNSQPLGDVILTNKTLGSFTGIQPRWLDNDLSSGKAT